MATSASIRHIGGSLISTLFPGYFALVMATGIIATGAFQQNLGWMAYGLYVIAAVAYAVLVVLVLIRLVAFPRLLFDDLFSHQKGFGFLTIVAATNVLGSASGVVHGWWGAAHVLWWISVVLWVPILYAALIAVVLRSPKPDIGEGINGTWFLLIVSTESIAVLGALLLARDGGEGLAFACLAVFLLGLVLYLIVMTMVFLRWTFNELEPTEASPPAWIAAGAVAITVLAGSNLLAAAKTSERLARLAPTLEVLVVLAWATATFWFPAMIAIGVWRHIVRGVPLRYHPSYWALVFPLGMYGAATFKMLAVTKLSALHWVPPVMLVVAGVAWSLTFFGMLYQGATAVARQARSA